MSLANKHEVLNALVEKLFEPEERRLQTLVSELDKANREIKGHTVMGFIYNGTAFIPPEARTRQSGGYPSLAFSLTNQASAWWADRQQIEEDKQLIRQILWLTVRETETVQDFRDAMPESIVELSEQLSAIPRQREDGFTLRHSNRLYDQYLRMRDKIDVYWACRMVY